jgi:hypothetical protein
MMSLRPTIRRTTSVGAAVLVCAALAVGCTAHTAEPIRVGAVYPL